MLKEVQEMKEEHHNNIRDMEERRRKEMERELKDKDDKIHMIETMQAKEYLKRKSDEDELKKVFDKSIKKLEAETQKNLDHELKRQKDYYEKELDKHKRDNEEIKEKSHVQIYGMHIKTNTKYWLADQNIVEDT